MTGTFQRIIEKIYPDAHLIGARELRKLQVGHGQFVEQAIKEITV